MNPQQAPLEAGGATRTLDFLVVDEFIRTMVDARALKTAFELGLVDRLVEQRSGSVEALGRAIGVDAPGLRLLLDMLSANRVVEERNGDVRLQRRFLDALRYRDLLETKLDFAGFSINDFADLFTTLVREPRGFASRARMFQLFDYRRCLEPSAENYAQVRAWMRITSTLTRYEARACLQLHDFSPYRRALDVGGNSGEFLLQLCRAHPSLTGTVLDLPLVCEVGMEHVLAEPEASRIGFLKADVRADPLPAGHDLISFKSMLHDWPAEHSDAFLAKAAAALAPGGTLLIFERAPLRGDPAPAFSLIPTLLFFRSYRAPREYVERLSALGLRSPEVREIQLDTPFFVVTARKAG